MQFSIPTSIQALALSALSLVPAALAADTSGTDKFEPVDGISASHGDATLTDSLLVIEKLNASSDRHTIADAILQLQKQLAAMPTTDELRLRLQAALDELLERAQNAYLDEFDLAMARRQVVDARLDRAFLALQDRAIGGAWTPEQMRSVAMGWLERADVFVDAPNPEDYRARVMAAMEYLLLTTTGVAETIREMRLELLRLQLQSAISRLDQAIANGTMTEEDHARLLKIYTIRTRVIYQSEF